MRSRRGAWTIGVAPAVLCLLLASARARGAGPSAEAAVLPIVLEIEGCEAIDQAELYKLLAIEFRTLDVLPREPRERVHVQCTAQRAVVRLESGSTSNEVDLRATAQALWPRLLALSVSELVTESRARVTPVVPATTPEPASPPPSEPTQATRDSERFRAFAGVPLGHLARRARSGRLARLESTLQPGAGSAFGVRSHGHLARSGRLAVGERWVRVASGRPRR